MMLTTSIPSALLLVLIAGASAAPAPAPAPPTYYHPFMTAKLIHTVHSFPGIWMENIALRSNGDILTTSAFNATPSVYLTAPSGTTTCGIVSFPNRGAFGIAELEPDVFAVATNDFQALQGGLRGTGIVYKLDLRSQSPCSTHITPQVIARFPDSAVLNGLAILPGTNKIAVSDSGAGVIWGADARTGAVSVLLNTTETRDGPPTVIPGTGVSIQSTVNGLKIEHGHVYFTNTGAQIFARAPITPDGVAKGPVEILARDLPADDFSLAPSFFNENKAAYIASGELDTVMCVDGASGYEKNVTTTVLGVTAAVFGRLPGEQTTLYVSTNGGAAAFFGNGTKPSGTITRIELA